MRKIILFCFFSLLAVFAHAAEPAAIEGYWQIIDDNGKPESIAVVYPHEGMYFCRMVALYDEDTGKVNETVANPKQKADGIKGNPYLCGLDFIWNLKPEGDGHRYKGTVTDPDNGNNYTCEVWFDKDKGTLVVRGEWLMFGENKYWPSIAEADVPAEARVDLKTLTPVIPAE